MVIVIPLTQGKETLIDDIDSDLIKYKWCANHNPRGDNFTARRRINKTTCYMGRIILERKKGIKLESYDRVFYKNGNTLDNRRENLTIGKQSCIVRHRKKNKNSSSKYKGVYLDKRNGLWVARITKRENGKLKKYHLGSFKSEITAARARDFAANAMFGPCAKLNIFDELEYPENEPDYTA